MRIQTQLSVPNFSKSIAWAATAISLLFLIFRLAVRVRSFRKLYSDDYLVIAAWLMLLTSTIIWQTNIYLLYWQYDVASGRAPYSEAFIAAYATFMPQVTTWTVLFYSCLWAIKFSFLMFFRRLGSEIKVHKVWWWVVFILTFAGWIASISDFDYRCSAGDISYILGKNHSGKSAHTIPVDKSSAMQSGKPCQVSDPHLLR